MRRDLHVFERLDELSRVITLVGAQGAGRPIFLRLSLMIMWLNDLVDQKAQMTNGGNGGGFQERMRDSITSCCSEQLSTT